MSSLSQKRTYAPTAYSKPVFRADEGPPILLAEQTAVKRIGSTPFGANLRRIIGRAIVDQNPLHIAVALPLEGTKRCGQAIRGIVNGHDN